jgi:hypothetical protein
MLAEDVIAKFTAAVEPIETGNQRRFEIVNNRKRITHENVNLLNDLYNKGYLGRLELLQVFLKLFA